MGKVWAEKREIFYEQGKWNALDNFTYGLFLTSVSTCLTICQARSDGNLNFDAMDSFMTDTLKSVLGHGSLAVRVFPPSSHVLISFAQRVASEVVR